MHGSGASLYERALHKRERHEQQAEHAAQHQRDLEHKEATFVPKINTKARRPLSAIKPQPRMPLEAPASQWVDSPAECHQHMYTEPEPNLSPYQEQDSLEAEVMKTMAEWKTLGLRRSLEFVLPLLAS